MSMSLQQRTKSLKPSNVRFTEQLILEKPTEETEELTLAGSTDDPEEEVLETTGVIHKRADRSKKLNEELSQITDAELESVVFDFYSSKEIEEMTVVEVNDPSDSGLQTVRDPRFGPKDPGDICQTCGNDFINCVGHYGRIGIPELMNPLAVKHITYVLSSVCNSCGKLLVTEEEIKKRYKKKSKGLIRLKQIKELVDNLNKTCENTFEDEEGPTKECNRPFVFIPRKKDNEKKTYYTLSYVEAGTSTSKLDPSDISELYPEEMFKILDNISTKDAKLLGFENGSHPRNMVMKWLIVIPYAVRLDIVQDGHTRPDDFSTMYSDVVKKTLTYNSIKSGETVKSTKRLLTKTRVTEDVSEDIRLDEMMSSIYFAIIHSINNSDGRYSQGRARPYSSLQLRIQGKEGLLRRAMQSKRVGAAGRTVIGPGPQLRINEIGIPELMAEKLTRDIVVTSYNRSELQNDYDNGRVKYIQIKRNSTLSDTRIFQIFIKKNPEYSIQIGDVVSRMLKDGDVVIVNRMPSLSKNNQLAGYVRILKGDRIIRINLSLTTPQNADFDGDEMNVYVPQTVQAYAEAENLMAVQLNLLGNQGNKPTMGIVYDTLSGSYIMSDPDLMINPGLYDEAITPVLETPQMKTLNKRLKRYNIKKYSGPSLISAAFPAGFFYNNNGAVIKDGILTSGRLGKSTLGTTEGSIITEMVKTKGSDITADFMSDIQFISHIFLTTFGLSIGITDCINDDPSFKEFIKATIQDAMFKVQGIATNPGSKKNKFKEAETELYIQRTLEGVRGTIGERALEFFEKDNALVIMASSGAKGSKFNSAQISAVLGQQNVNGKRLPISLPGNRASTFFPPKDPGSYVHPEEQGFCVNSFSSGLTPTEYFSHSQGAREGLTDTAITSGVTGALQRDLVKSLEDLVVAADGSVRGPGDIIIQFTYGEDGLDPAKLSSVKKTDRLTDETSRDLIPVNVFNLADQINSEFMYPE